MKKELIEYTKENTKSEELMEDFDILIQAWLKSDNENTTHLAWSLSNYAVEKLITEAHRIK